MHQIFLSNEKDLDFFLLPIMLLILMFDVKTLVAPAVEPATPKLLMTIRGFGGELMTFQIGMGLFLIICSHIKDLSAAKIVLLAEVALMICCLIRPRVEGIQLVSGWEDARKNRKGGGDAF